MGGVKNLFCISFLLLVVNLGLTKDAIAQNEGGDKVEGTIRFDFMVPQPVSNPALKKSFTGIMDIGTGIYLTTPGGFVVGVMGRYKQFQVPSNKINNTVTTQMNVVSSGLSLGFDYFKSKKTLITPGLNIGYNWIFFNQITTSTDSGIVSKFNAVNVEPFCKVDWMIGDGFGIGVVVAYNIMTYEFDPHSVGLDQYKTYSEYDKKGLAQSFSFGFCAYWNWAKREKAAY